MPSDAAVEEVDGVLAGLVSLAERVQRVAKQAQQARCLLTSIEIAPIATRPGAQEEAGHQSAEHGDGGISQPAVQLDELGRDDRAPAAGIEVTRQPARSDVALTYELGPTVGMNAIPAARIEATVAHKAQSAHQGEQVPLARRFR